MAMAVVTWRGHQGFKLTDGGGGGTAVSKNGWGIGKILILLAGYPAPPLLGLGGLSHPGNQRRDHPCRCDTDPSDHVGCVVRICRARLPLGRRPRLVAPVILCRALHRRRCDAMPEPTLGHADEPAASSP
jgi:hypothetical protein